jgi:hypothetical protein
MDARTRRIAATSRRARGLLAVALAALLLVLAAPACSRRRPSPTQPGPETLPPEVKAVWPPPRSGFVVAGAPYQVWAEFNLPLDPATVDTLHVFFMIDTRRLKIRVTWDSTLQRINVYSYEPLNVLQAYTVELSPRLRSATGVPLGKTYSWQFRTCSVRNPSPGNPGDGGLNVSPFALLWWVGNLPGDPPVSYYEVFAGRDRDAVAARAVPLLYRGPFEYYVPRTRWPQDGAPIYWAVNAVNMEWGDRAIGPVWQFGTVAASTRVDSVKVILGSSGYSPSNTYGRCDDAEIIFGPGYNAALVWNLKSLPITFRRTARLAGARMLIAAPAGYDAAFDSSSTTLWSATTDWACDAIRLDGPPFANEAEGPVATGVHAGPSWIRFMSDTLTAHLEATIRVGGFYGYILRADRLVHCLSPTTTLTTRRPWVTLYYYR